MKAIARGLPAGRYTNTAIALHWIIAVLIACNLVLVWTVGSLPGGDVRAVIDMHKSIGLTVLGLAAMRLLWRLSHRPPPLDPAIPRLERRAAHAAHVTLYVLIFAMPLSGYVHDSAWRGAASHPLRLFGLVAFPRIAPLMHLPPPARDRVHDLFFAIHANLAYALYALVALHVAGALKHQFVDRQPELGRMWPGEDGQEPVRSGKSRTGLGV